MWRGPQAQTHSDRRHMVDHIVADLHRVYGTDVTAMALYGSLARGEDGPHSDIELWCAVNRPGLDKTEEWVYGLGKAEVNVYGVDVVQREATAVTDDWSLRQGEWINVLPLFGDLAYFDDLRRLVFSPPKQVFGALIARMIVGECFEWMGKLRNAVDRGRYQSLPRMACDFANYVALMVGLAHRTIYRSGGSMIAEARQQTHVPTGYAALARLTTAGDLGEAARVAAALEAVWAGLEPWCEAQEVDLSPLTGWPWP